VLLELLLPLRLDVSSSLVNCLSVGYGAVSPVWHVYVAVNLFMWASWSSDLPRLCGRQAWRTCPCTSTCD